MVRFFGFAARSITIGLVATFALIRYGFARLSIYEDQDAVDHLRGRVARGAMTALGATFIKLGQVMSTRPDLFPPAFIAELRLLQDKLPPFPVAQARARIETELGQPVDEVFSELDETPIAAASVAQVHRGRLRESGIEVAVKVLRPDVREKTERDGTILMAFAHFAERLSEVAAHANFSGHAEHFLEGVLSQTDLTREAENYETFRANFASVPHIRFPHVYPEASGKTVMTMDLMKGRKVDALRPTDDTPTIAKRLRRAFLKMLFEDGFLHADLHPGNMLVDDEGNVAIFDVGLATRLSDEMLEYYIDFNKCLAIGTAPDFVQHLRRYHSYVEGEVDWDDLASDVEVTLGMFRGKTASEIEMGAMIERLFAVGRKYGVRPFPEMTLIMVGLVTAEGIGKQLAPELDSFQEVASYLMPILMQRGMLPVGLVAGAALG
ncbi:MAG: AarF/ABC1/UbiB kinase family protein [Myxococcales bacterium]|nr:AarF/ABC1/UbiB kinase family protein [Myxococcales bacterium]